MAGALRSLFAEFGFKFDSAPVKAAMRLVDDFKKQLQSDFGKKIPKGLSVSSVKGWADGVVAEVQGAAAGIRGAAALSGLGIEEVQKWGFAGIGPELLGKAFRGLGKTMAGAEDGLKSSKKAFEAVGVATHDADGNMRPLGDVFDEVGAALADIENPAQRAALGQRLFGKAAAEVLPTFAKGRAGLQQLRDRYRELGGGLSEKTIASVARLGRAEKDLSFVTVGLKGALAGELAPAMEAGTKKLAELGAWFRELSERSNIFRAVALALGAVLVGAALSSYAAWIPWIALALIVAAAIDDVWTALEGGDSIVGRFIESMLGAGALATLRSAWQEGGISAVLAFGGAFLAAAPALWVRVIQKIVGLANGVGEAIGQWILDNAPSLGAKMQDLGGALVDGVAQGITSGVGRVLAGLGDLGVAIKEKFKETFGIHSPSEVFADLGSQIPAGLANGIRSGAAGVEAAGRAGLVSPLGLSGLGGGGPTTIQAHVENTFHVDGSTSESARAGIRDGAGDSTEQLLIALEGTA